ncbi:MAG: class II aldolase/adducin family protein [Deltaproteobacteria bacterium]|nr:class II aldolase/adducin family protein [Deltaproteobacteria bacterium]
MSESDEILVQTLERAERVGLSSIGDGALSTRIADACRLHAPRLHAAPRIYRAAAAEQLAPIARLHLAIYRRNPHVSAVLQLRPPRLQALALAGLTLPQCLLVAPSQTIVLRSEPDAERRLAEQIDRCGITLLGLHGVLISEVDAEQALRRVSELDRLAEVTLALQQFRSPQPPSERQIREQLLAGQWLGETAVASRGCESCNACSNSRIEQQTADDAVSGAIERFLQGQLEH